MVKGIKQVFSSIKTLLKVFELILCIIGLFLVETETIFYNRCVFEMLIVGLGGYVLICSVLLVVDVIEETPPQMLDHLFMVIGAFFNVLAGVMTIVCHSAPKDCQLVIQAGLSTRPGEHNDILIAIFSIVVGTVMLGDFLRSFVDR